MDNVRCPVLVGRDAELERLRARLDTARAGRGGLLLILGEAGVGKSRLLRELREHAISAGLPVLTGRAVDRAIAPFRPLSEALLAAADRAGIDNDVASGPFGPILARLWEDDVDDFAANETACLALGEAITRVMAAIAENQGAVLLLEDLHWADADTLKVVEYLADHLQATRALCIAVVRSGEVGMAERWARDLTTRRIADIVEPDRLDLEEVEAMTTACLGDGRFPGSLVAFLHSRSEGVPLAVEELLAGLLSDGALSRTDRGWKVASRLVPRVPTTLVESVQRRLAALDANAGHVVHAAAVLGPRFEWSLLPSVTNLSQESVIGALRDARDAQLVVVEDNSFRFRHALVRDAILDELLPPERVHLARAALSALENADPALAGDHCELAVALAVEAGNNRRAVELLVETARRALALGAVSSAATAIERARALASDRPPLDLDEVAAQAAALAGEVDLALALGRSALDAADDEGADDQVTTRRARLHLVLARALLGAGRWREAAEEAGRAAEFAEAAVDRGLVAAAEAAGAQAAIAYGHLDEARALAEKAVSMGEANGAPAAACEALEVLGRLARLQDVEEAERHFERALAVAERHDLALWRARALHELGTIDLFTNFRRDRLLEARKTAPPALLALVELHLSSIGQARWEGEEAYEAAARCVDLSRKLGLVTLGMGLVHLATSAALARRPAQEIDAAVAEALDIAGDDIDVAAGVPGRVRFIQALARGDLDAVRNCLDEAVEILRKDHSATFPFRGLWALLRTVHDANGDAARAEVTGSAGGSIPVNREMVRMAEAVAAGRAGRRDEAEALSATALVRLNLWEGADALLALVLFIAAPEALRDGWGDGGAWLRRALADFEDLGLTEMASACRAALRDAGEPVPRKGRGDSEVPAHLRDLGVTSRETDVLRLLADRLSNREIARRLSLSPRTVERHVANLLTKTGAADRHQAAALLESSGASH